MQLAMRQSRPPVVSASATLLLLLSTLCSASPSHYFAMHSTKAVRAALRTRLPVGVGGGTAVAAAALSGTAGRRLAEQASSDGIPASGGIDCGKPPSESGPPDPMWFTQADCYLSSMDGYAYMDASGQFRNASKGELVQQHCDDVFCAVPKVPNCYEQPEICGRDEWCWIDQHEKWGAWAMGAGGTTPIPDACGPDSLAAIESANMTEDERAALRATRNRTCTSGISYGAGLEVWKPVRGQCVRYRQLQQSCIDNPLSFTLSAFDSPFARSPDGKVYVRPLVCDPRGGPGGTPLVCTGPEFNVLPSTCVQARPRDQCFSGPWWISTECPRTAPGAPAAGLSPEQARAAASTAVLLFAGEVAWPATCEFWDTSKPKGRATEAARRRLYAIVSTVWPSEKVAGLPPAFEDLLAPLNISSLTNNIDSCYQNEDTSGSPQAAQLAALGQAAMQQNKVWSLVHFLAHNQPAPMSTERVQARRALAEYLATNFWCDDCRGFFYEGVISTYGLPPDRPDPQAHARSWWWAHNVASEHVASVRGGHPWIHLAGAADVARFQNPFFMRWEDAVAQWKVQASSS